MVKRTFLILSVEGGMSDHIISKICGIRDPKTLIKYKKLVNNQLWNRLIGFGG